MTFILLTAYVAVAIMVGWPWLLDLLKDKDE